jgi:hypothetical protein
MHISDIDDFSASCFYSRNAFEARPASPPDEASRAQSRRLEGHSALNYSLYSLVVRISGLAMIPSINGGHPEIRV